MKKRMIIFMFLFFTVTFLNAGPADSLRSANQYYISNDFAKAILAYERIVQQGYESAALYYNLGNAYYKHNELARSILNFERAKLLAPNDEAVSFNLDLVNQFVVDKIEALPRPFFIKWWQSLINSRSSNGWATISLLMFVGSLALLAFYLFSRSAFMKKTGFALAVILFLASLISFGFSGAQKRKIVNRHHAIIFAPTVTVKASPAESGTDLFVIHEGLKVEITEELGLWFEIKLADGNSGWVQKTILEKI